MNASLFLLFILLGSCVPLIFFNKVVWIIIPVVIALLLIVWIIFSSIAKDHLRKTGVLPENQRDIVEGSDSIFKPNSLLKELLAAYGMAIALMIVFFALCYAISPEISTRYVSFLPFNLVLLVAFAISYLFIRYKMK